MPSSRSRLPTLAPRLPGNAAPAVDKPSVKEHTEEEWRSRKGLIESLYINDNRKLNETMAIMESKYGFAATEQMYKKRFKKWNIRKRAYRKSPVASSPTASTPSSSAYDASECKEDLDADSHSVKVVKTTAAMARTSPPPCFAQLKVYARLENVLGSILSWNQEKLESHRSFPDPMSKYLANPNQPPIQDSRTMYRIFELLFDLWAHGRGDLAGMAARKGFYVLEFVLTEDHPDLIWHILDTVYDMVDRGHLQLLSMFLQHANVLARTQFPPNHPILRILQQLIGCDTRTEQGRQYICHLLRQAWLRNVDLLSERIGSTSSQHLWLYEQLIWDGRTRLRRKSGLEKRKEIMYQALQGLGLGIQEDGVGDHDDDDDEVDCTDLRIDALILEFTQMDIGDKARAEELAKELLYRTSGDSGSRSNARFHAYARKMLARLHETKQDWDQVEENLKWAVRKREDAHGTGANLRVIRDMWVLSAYYERSGKLEMAAQTNHDALRRAKCYLEDLPG
ncbi:hypothetical protein ESCO_004364 [Escovopsis weberi]|uniref:Clr5 domain-containing protein n=1 Tax=Escovopsis weberi TaxID=150374 RepID=A0A0M9VVJ0_ESCWE|nr:hypothetical protein ESCO_004364 [Escovopsis weberi]